jgi:hypothetical protein
VQIRDAYRATNARKARVIFIGPEKLCGSINPDLGAVQTCRKRAFCYLRRGFVSHHKLILGGGEHSITVFTFNKDGNGNSHPSCGATRAALG